MSPQDVEFLDRVHPATRSNPLGGGGKRAIRTPTTSGRRTRPGRCTPSRACAATWRRTSPGRHGFRSTNDAVTRLQRRPSTRSSRSSTAPASWCRDIQHGPLVLHGARRLERQRRRADDVTQAAARRHPVGRRHGPAATARPRSTPTTPSTRLTPPNPARLERRTPARSTKLGARPTTAASSTAAARSASQAYAADHRLGRRRTSASAAARSTSGTRASPARNTAEPGEDHHGRRASRSSAPRATRTEYGQSSTLRGRPGRR